MLRHNVQSTDPQYDRLTDVGRQQALATGQRLAQSAHLTAVVSAPERRTQDTALAVTMYSMLPMASVDGALTSKAYDTEPPEARAARGLAAVERFLHSTRGDVAIVSHGHLIQFMVLNVTKRPLEGDSLKYEMVNAGVQQMRVVPSANGHFTWTKLAGDQLVRDD